MSPFSTNIAIIKDAVLYQRQKFRGGELSLPSKERPAIY